MVTIIRAGMLIDGTGREPVCDAGIVVDEGRVGAVGPFASLAWRQETVIDLSHATVMPGMMDLHMAFTGRREYGEFDTLKIPHDTLVCRAVLDAEKLLMAGFTTVRDNSSHIGLGMRQAQAEGSVRGPRVFASGGLITQTAGHADTHYLPLSLVRQDPGRKIADGADECRRAAREFIREGVDLLKICTTGGVGSEKDHPSQSQMTLDEIRAVCEEARRVSIPVASHAQGTEGVKNALIGGVLTIEHGCFLDEEACDMMVRGGNFLVPTLAALHRIITQGQKYGLPEYRLRKANDVQDAAKRSFRLALDMGVKIAMGTDHFGPAIRPHGENAEELGLMVAAGMTPMQAIVATTGVAATALGPRGASLGTLEPGKHADLIALARNPLDDIQSVMDVGFVMQGGRVFKDGLH